MGVFFPDVELPSGCQKCRFAPMIYTPQEDGTIIKEQICLVKKELIQSAVVNSTDEFPDGWWDDKSLECPGIIAELADNNGDNTENEKEEEAQDIV